MPGWMNGSARASVRIGPWRGTLVPVGRFALGIALGAGKLFSSCSPFGTAAVAAAVPGAQGAVYLLGVMAGYVLTGDLFYAFRYIAASLMIFIVGFATREASFRKAWWYMPAVAAVILGLTGIPYIDRNIGNVPGPMRLFLDVVMGGGGACVFSVAFQGEPAASEGDENRRSISFTVLAACALMGASAIRLFGVVSIGRFAALIVVMAAGFCGGPFAGCAAGAALGLGMDLTADEALFHCAAYAASGFFAGAAYRLGRLTYCVVYCAGNALCVLLAWRSGARIPELYECFAASVVFLILPQSVLAPVGSLLRVGRGRGERAFRLYQANRLNAVADGFAKLYEAAVGTETSSDDERELVPVFDRAADIVCRTCAGKEQCWKNEHAETVRALSDMSSEMLRKGAIETEDLPEAFRRRCVSPASFAGAVNGELRGLMYKRQYAARLRESRAAAYGQFLDMADVIRGASAALDGTAGSDPQAERRLIRYLKARELDASCAVFRDGAGRLHISVEGADAGSLCEEADYLEKLSDVMGARLCRVGAEKGTVTFRQAEPLAVSVGIASMKKEGEIVSGDRGTYFKTDNGLLCVILSDGMGTGESAAAESAIAVDILKALLTAGVEPGCAMRLLNSSAMLKNGENWGYATVDLCCIDLFSGEASFYKYGAAPSFVKTGRAIRRIKGASLAAGMLAGSDSAPDRIRVRLRPGNVALIASDGVLAEKQDQWLRDILAASDGLETKTIALRALRAASARFGNMDDMTALAIRVEERR